MKENIKEFIGETIFKVFGLKRALKIYFHLKTGKKLNLKNPKTFNEKIQCRKLNYKNELYSLCADKYKVREYVKKLIGEKYLIPLLYSGENITKEDIDKLPNSFVIKTNNASKTNIIVLDKSKESIDSILIKVKKYLNKKFWYRSFEMFYKNIDKRVIVEQLLLSEKNKIPDDYKFHVFKNKIIIQIDTDRFENHKRAFYDENWNKLDYSLGFEKNNKSIKEPQNLKEMIKIAKNLSKDFEYVRVDLYNVDGKIYFGELTFTHGSGYEKFVPYEMDYEWGSYWE
jgi:hypothetical protein